MRLPRSFLGLLIGYLATASCTSEGGGTGPGEVASVRVTPASEQIAATQSTTFAAEALDADGNVLTGKVFSFTSLNPAVATVVDPAANPVTVTGVAAGSATITAATEGKTGSAGLTVSAGIQLAGRVADGATGLGIAAAKVDFRTIDGTENTLTEGDGSFSLTVRDIGHQFLNATATKSGYVSATLISTQLNPPSTQLESILLVPETSVKGAIRGTVRNARTNQGIPGVSVTLRRNQGLAGSSIGQSISDPSGAFSFPDLDAGTYTLWALTQGFHSGARTAISLESDAGTAQDLILSPLGANLITVVLTWGANPSDLDAHLTGPGVGSARFHVSNLAPGNLTAPPFAALEVDDTQSFGPETIAITQLSSGTYRYSVHDPGNGSSGVNTILGASGAKVQVYYPASSQTFFVPNQPGNLWTVFELGGNIAAPTITVKNEMGFEQNAASILKMEH